MLLLWAGAISLFYHQWGKIRGIDDYQPDYVHANMTIQHNPIPEEAHSDKIVSDKLNNDEELSIGVLQHNDNSNFSLRRRTVVKYV